MKSAADKVTADLLPAQFIIESRLRDLVDCSWRPIPFYVRESREVADVDCAWLNSAVKAFEYRVVPA